MMVDINKKPYYSNLGDKANYRKDQKIVCDRVSYLIKKNQGSLLK